MSKLTIKQETFCIEYCKLRNATKSALKAGYSAATAYSIGQENLKKPEIIERIAEIRAEYLEQSKIEGQDIVNALIEHAFWNIQDFIDDGNVIKDLKTIDRETAAPIAGIKIKETFTTVGGITTKEVTTELKLSDKRAALVDLGRHVGIFEKDNEQGRTITPPLSDSQFEQLLQAARETKTDTSQWVY